MGGHVIRPQRWSARILTEIRVALHLEERVGEARIGLAHGDDIGPGGEVTGWLDLFTFPLIDTESGQFNGIIEYARDITKRKVVENELLKYHEQLEDLIKERTSEIVKTNEDLQKEIHLFRSLEHLPQDVRI